MLTKGIFILLWKQIRDIISVIMKIQDVVYGNIEIEEKVLLELINSSSLKRLLKNSLKAVCRKNTILSKPIPDLSILSELCACYIV